jgi:hypothetical protein
MSQADAMTDKVVHAADGVVTMAACRHPRSEAPANEGCWRDVRVSGSSGCDRTLGLEPRRKFDELCRPAQYAHSTADFATLLDLFGSEQDAGHPRSPFRESSTAIAAL